MKQNGFKHTTTSPYYPSTNGLAEWTVQTSFLLHYCVTPQSTTELSPAKRLIGRRLHTHSDLIHPDTTQRLSRRKEVLRNLLLLDLLKLETNCMQR